MTSRQRRCLRFMVRRLLHRRELTLIEFYQLAGRASRQEQLAMMRRLIKRGGIQAINRDCLVMP